MPTADSILSWASAVANDWRWVAALWHVALAACLMALAAGVRPSTRLAGYLLVLPAASVGALAWVSHNPFNGLTFAALTLLLLRAATSLPLTTVRRARMASRVAGVALVAFGWTYPHFLRTDTWTTYAYASPFGLLPCPTLSLMLGVTLTVDGLRSTRWSVPLVVMGLLYGWIGVFWLRVSLDIVLLAGAIVLGMIVAAELFPGRVRASETPVFLRHRAGEHARQRIPDGDIPRIPRK